MMLELKLRRTGNSIGLVLPKEALAHLGVEEGDAVFLTFLAEGALRLSAAVNRFTLSPGPREEARGAGHF